MMEDTDMATNKRVFTLRLTDEVFDKIDILASAEHRSMTNAGLVIQITGKRK